MSRHWASVTQPRATGATRAGQQGRVGTEGLALPVARTNEPGTEEPAGEVAIARVGSAGHHASYTPGFSRSRRAIRGPPRTGTVDARGPQDRGPLPVASSARWTRVTGLDVQDCACDVCSHSHSLATSFSAFPSRREATLCRRAVVRKRDRLLWRRCRPHMPTCRPGRAAAGRRIG